MLGFIGEYESTVDSKGRFLLPVGFKKQLPETEKPLFVLNRGFEKCLTLYPLQTWTPLYEKISRLNDFDPKVREFRRYFLNGAVQIEPDGAGRILIPKNLMEYATLSKDIVLCKDVIGKRDQIEALGIRGGAYDQLAEEARCPAAVLQGTLPPLPACKPVLMLLTIRT